MGGLRVRPASGADAEALCTLLNAIITRGGTTAHRRPFDAERMLGHYIGPARLISCLVAEDGTGVAGFQSLEWCDPEWTGPDRLPGDWAVIASFVGIGKQGGGVGRALWAGTKVAAEAAGVRTIDATIRADNSRGLGFYSSLGFVDYDRLVAVPLSDGTRVDRVRKRYDVIQVAR